MHHFFAYLARMKLIDRWSLMRCVSRENVQEHSLQVAQVAHALALIKKKKYGGQAEPAEVALRAIYHDATEVMTGDLPTPVKYFSPEMRAAYQRLEGFASEQMLRLLPAEFREDYRPLLESHGEDEVGQLVKAADTICAYLKCLEERAAGNHEFSGAQKTIEAKLNTYRASRPEVDEFVRSFVPSFNMTLDEISRAEPSQYEV